MKTTPLYATTIFGVAIALSGNIVVHGGAVAAEVDATNNIHQEDTALSPLEKARLLQIPTTESARLGGEQENIDFWEQHQVLLKDAWKQWADEQFLDNTLQGRSQLINGTLYERVYQAWEVPQTEQAVKDLFHEVAPGVFVIDEFFTRKGIRALRQFHLDAIASTHIPTRRPNGMNRFGLVLDDEVEGGVSYAELDDFRAWLVDILVRPIARAMFPEYATNDMEHPNDDVSYAFTVHYSHDGSGVDDGGGDKDKQTKEETTKDDPVDTEEDGNHEDRYLPEHTDASLYTFNINLNFEEEDDPSNPAQLVFYNPDTNSTKTLAMKPGMAVLHRGMHAHQALPLKNIGKQQKSRRRDQLIIWLFGRDQQDYYVRAMPYEKEEQMTVKERWSRPASVKEGRAAANSNGDFPTDWL